MSRSGVVPRLFGHEAEPRLDMHPQDMARRGLREGEFVRLGSARGRQVFKLRADAGLRIGQLHAPMHWGSEFVSGAGIKAVTQPGFCPEARQPELKFAAVNVERVELPWRVSAAVWGAQGRSLRELLNEFDYAHCVPVAGLEGEEGWSFEAAATEAPAAELLARMSRLLGLDGVVGLLRYADARRGRSRLLALAGEGDAATLRALLLVGEAGVAAWLLPLWRERAPVKPYARQLLAPEPVAPVRASSPQVCNCFDVSEARIRACLAKSSGTPAERLVAVQAELRCGTQCGSCLPTLRRLSLEQKEEVSA
jgi:assimilatory nitrate reductase catalytic subunit